MQMDEGKLAENAVISAARLHQQGAVWSHI